TALGKLRSPPVTNAGIEAGRAGGSCRSAFALASRFGEDASVHSRRLLKQWKNTVQFWEETLGLTMREIDRVAYCRVGS
ncbi:MAG TPA: hypothetical protein VEF36_17760, partial [Roseiarcus sp.]|nr:hypothetical protein [Roseiarcus sp.]